MKEVAESSINLEDIPENDEMQSVLKSIHLLILYGINAIRQLQLYILITVNPGIQLRRFRRNVNNLLLASSKEVGFIQFDIRKFKIVNDLYGEKINATSSSSLPYSVTTINTSLRRLIKYSIPVEMAVIRKEGLILQKCPKALNISIDILEDMLADHMKEVARQISCSCLLIKSNIWSPKFSPYKSFTILNLRISN